MIGWSYGGFLSALAVLDAPTRSPRPARARPPTDWTLYDTHYTERFLGLDPQVYERNSIIVGRAEARPTAHADPRLRRRQRDDRAQPAAESGADGGRPAAHLPAAQRHHAYDQ
jgi:hypothetical protein